MTRKPAPRIIALNLPAKLDRTVAGNPVTTRLETVPANCFPGLDADIRNLDRRFFPGLVFNFVHAEDNDPGVQGRGAVLVQADPGETGLNSKNRALNAQLTKLGNILPSATVVLDSIKPDGGVAISLRGPRPRRIPYDYDVTWRIVRSLEAGPLAITLAVIKDNKRVRLMTLRGERRVYQNTDGEISPVYQAGELTQSLCSPWQHDFRDCVCSYWASNHPDIVMAAHPADIAEMDDPGADQDRAEDPIVWMRWDREKRVSALPAVDAARTAEMDHYEINHRWKELSIVLEGREQLTPWVLTPFPAVRHPEMDPIKELRKLAGMEQALAIEYIYARYTVRFYEDLPGEDGRLTKFIAHELLNVAIGEMMHLRWANELLHELQLLANVAAVPALRVGRSVPSAVFQEEHPVGRHPIYTVTDRPAQERDLKAGISDFVAAELPSGTLSGKYAGILALLKHGWPKPGAVRPDLVELTERIVSDGIDHYARFREIESMLNRPGGDRLVKKLNKLKPESSEFRRALKLYTTVIDNLTTNFAAHANTKAIDAAQRAMLKLDSYAKDLAKRGKAIPFLTIAQTVARRKKLP